MGAKPTTDTQFDVRHAPQEKANEILADIPPRRLSVPPIAICILAFGSRGDVQPFVAIGLRLQEHGHRVRLAAEAVHRDLVTGEGLEFYPLAGNVQAYMSNLASDRGLFSTNAKGEKDWLEAYHQFLYSCDDACTESQSPKGHPFIIQALISNGEACAHIHCAQKHKIPLFMAHPCPVTITRAFPNLLLNLSSVRSLSQLPGKSRGILNYLSWAALDFHTYWTVYSAIDCLRVEKLGLPSVRLGRHGMDLMLAQKVPTAYLWSPSLLAKPYDWGPQIDVTGYCFLEEKAAKRYSPTQDLYTFLAAGPAPIYLGFGSMILKDKQEVESIILRAFDETGLRVLLSKGWAKLGEDLKLPSNVFRLGNVPHSWLFPQCTAVIHHGGAGSTAAGLIAACPTLIIPFFGDQHLWGRAVNDHNLGPPPIPIDTLTTKRLVEALGVLQSPEVKLRAEEISQQLKSEDGLEAVVQAFHRHLPVESLLAGKPTEWHLTELTMGGIFTEILASLADIVMHALYGRQAYGLLGSAGGIVVGIYLATMRLCKAIAYIALWVLRK